MTRLEFLLTALESDGHDAFRHTRSVVEMADYRFRVNLERLEVDPLSVKTQMDWTDRGYRLVIDGPSSEEILTQALATAMEALGVRADRA